MTRGKIWSLVLILLCLLASVLQPASPAHASSVITGYSSSQQVTVTGGSASVGGSTTTPVTTTSTDYVVQLHLSGSQAAKVYAGVSDQSAFNDVTMWWYNGTTYQQLDIDYDTTTNGAWSSSNMTLWFRLQAPIGAAPATDSNYYLAWGNASPTVMRSWANIYSFQDAFSTADATKWNNINGAGISVGGSALTIAAGGAMITSTISTTVGQLISFRGQIPSTSGSWDEPRFLLQSTVYPGSDFQGINFERYYSSTQWGCYWNGGRNLLGTSDPVGSPAYHIFSIVRTSNTSGICHADAATANNSGHSSHGEPFYIIFQSGGSTPITVNWIKVRPWITTEPSLSLSGCGAIVCVSSSTLSVGVTAAALSLSLPSSVTATGVTLNGSARTSTVTFSTIAITDARGSGAGWTLSINTPDLINAGGKTIPFSGITVSPATGVINDVTSSAIGGLTTGSSGALSGTDTTPGTTASSNYTVLTAPANQGMGSYTEAPALSIAVPANTFTGAYSSTVTLTLQ